MPARKDKRIADALHTSFQRNIRGAIGSGHWQN